MSEDWRVYCLDCEEEHYFCDANHERELMRNLVRFKHEIAHLRRLFEVTGPELVLKTHYGLVNVEWFAKHVSHRLVARSEYGEVAGAVACNVCGAESTQARTTRVLDEYKTICGECRIAVREALRSRMPK